MDSYSRCVYIEKLCEYFESLYGIIQGLQESHDIMENVITITQVMAHEEILINDFVFNWY